MRFFVGSLLAIGACVWVGVQAVTRQHRGVHLGYEIHQATSDRHDLKDTLRDLQIQRAELLDPKRLERLALLSGLHVPTPDLVVIIGPETPDGP